MTRFAGAPLRVLPFERLLFASDTLAVGTHRLPADDPRFESYGPTSAHLIVFPRNHTIIEHAGGARFVGSPAVAPLYNRGQEYRRHRLSAEGDFCEWFAVAPELLREIVGRDDDRPLRAPFVRVEPSDYLRQRGVVEHVLRGGSDALFVEETMMAVLRRILVEDRQSCLSPPSRQAGLPVLHAAEIVGRTFKHNHSLTRIAREAGTSPFHLARTFKRVMGTTLHQHRLAVRLHTSLAMLRDTRDDISTIALDLGFTDHSHFTVSFRRRFGITPSAYRRGATFS
ncbi:MAG TPA: helix-turn-helix transcriptional regulator [Thermoanaerobaculia bacterium]|nr:helix-turn-helix transcriptional regulator [Thermoanaerobaculia bacterium]